MVLLTIVSRVFLQCCHFAVHAHTPTIIPIFNCRCFVSFGGMIMLTPNHNLLLCPPRFKLTQLAVDTSAGPYKNHTVLFLGSEDGRVLKILASTHLNASFSTQLLEDIDVYNPTKSASLSPFSFRYMIQTICFIIQCTPLITFTFIGSATNKSPTFFCPL